MAENSLQNHLFYELCKRFPEVPQDVVNDLIIKNSCNRVKCIEALGKESDRYLYNPSVPVTKFNQLSVTNSSINNTTGSNSEFRDRTNSTGSIGSSTSSVQQPISHFHYQQQYPHCTNSGYHIQQPQIHITHNTAASRQTSGDICVQPPSDNRSAPGNWGNASPNKWSNEGYPPSSVSYQQYQMAPALQTYSSRENWSSPPRRPYGFNERFPLNNGDAASSPGTPPSKTSSIVINTPVTNGAFNSQISGPGLSPTAYDQMHQQQYQGQFGGSLNPPSSGLKHPQNQYTSHMVILPPNSMRIPSPSQPPPNSGTFYNPPAAVPPQSLPPFAYSQQKSSDSNSSPVTPQYPQYHHPPPSVFQLQSPQSMQEPQMGASPAQKSRVAFQIPEVTKTHTEQNVMHRDGGYMMAGDNPEYNMMGRTPQPDHRSFHRTPSGDTQFTGYVGTPVEYPQHRKPSIEDTQYLQTLLNYQEQRKKKLFDDMQESIRLQSMLKQDVLTMENEVLRRKSRSNAAVTADDVHKIRQVNRLLKIDVQLLTREIDLVNNGQTPLGIPDTHFYKNIAPGQEVLVHSNNSSRPSTPPRRPVPPPPRPPQPPLPSRDILDPPPVLGPSRPPPPAPGAQPEDDEVESDKWNCSACTFLNHQDLDKCEICEMPRIMGGMSGY